VVWSHSDREKVVYNHFLKHLGSYVPRKCRINLASLGWQSKPLDHLEADVSEAELKHVILNAPKEKAPGPDGFIGLFFSTCWSIIKHDLLTAIQHFCSLNQQNLHLLNEAYIVLVPKKSCPERVTDFRPISLAHSFSKILSKILASRLGSELDSLISSNQTTFIKQCCIHDSFMFVQEAIRELHKKKIPAMFIKLDISKAFDMVNWPYLLDIMSFLGFGQKWRNWMSSLWCTTYSSVLLNGEPSSRILHCRGMRQGDPLSLMLFLVAMEPLQLLFKKVV
jgi:hypothetical protein